MTTELPRSIDCGDFYYELVTKQAANYKELRPPWRRLNGLLYGKRMKDPSEREQTKTEPPIVVRKLPPLEFIGITGNFCRYTFVGATACTCRCYPGISLVLVKGKVSTCVAAHRGALASRAGFKEESAVLFLKEKAKSDANPIHLETVQTAIHALQYLLGEGFKADEIEVCFTINGSSTVRELSAKEVHQHV